MAHHTSEQEPVPALTLGSALPSSAQPVLQTTSEAPAKMTPLHLYPGDSRRPHLLQAAEVTLQRGEPEWLARPVERSRATLPNLFSYIWTPQRNWWHCEPEGGTPSQEEGHRGGGLELNAGTLHKEIPGENLQSASLAIPVQNSL